MGYRTDDFNCPECEASRIVMYDKTDGPGEVICRSCGTQMVRGFPAPKVMRAGFTDGQERGERWTMLKQASKFEQQASRARKNGKAEEYAELKKESIKLNKRAQGKRDKTDK